jgi:hypothetical protein
MTAPETPKPIRRTDNPDELNKLLASKLTNNEVELPSAETLDEIFKEWNNIFSPPNTKL